MMKTQPSSIQKLVAQVRAELLADRKKTAIMGALVLVAAFMGLRLLGGKARPARATASPAAETTEPRATAAGHPQPNAALDEYLAHMDRQVSRDLFAADFSAYPAGPVVEKPKADDAPRTPAVDPAAIARLEYETAARREAERLLLQGTMPGGNPSAIINGQVVGVGQMFEGFEIRSIGQGSCVVARGAVEVTLRMNP
ncbi:MAG: hypothetical protein GX591_03550 [Planctomycetes bacterium]|nr:hypothetical protein [Planctomycetota bacterium]